MPRRGLAPLVPKAVCWADARLQSPRSGHGEIPDNLFTFQQKVLTLAVFSSAATAPPACEAKSKRATSSSPFLVKRIAQTDLVQVAQSWQNLCEQSGGSRIGAGGDPCVVLAGQNGISALLANADQCAQQDNADAMVDFAKSSGVNNKQALIANAIAYRKHPRNALNIGGVVPSTLFCERAPRNSELNGVVNAQLQGVDPGLFGSPSTGIVAFGAREFLIFPSFMFCLVWCVLKHFLDFASWHMSLWPNSQRGHLLLQVEKD
jgi:hypothetical protein